MFLNLHNQKHFSAEQLWKFVSCKVSKSIVIQKAWVLVVRLFRKMDEFFWGLAPFYASVKSDFSIINGEMNKRCANLTGMSFNGALLSKQTQY